MIGMLRRIFKKWDVLYSTALIANCCFVFFCFCFFTVYRWDTTLRKVWFCIRGTLTSAKELFADVICCLYCMWIDWQQMASKGILI